MTGSTRSSTASARFQHVKGSFIPRADAAPIAFPGPLGKNGKPSPELLRLFIQKCLLTTEQPRMSAGDWNNLGYAYARLPKPDFQSARRALSRAQALTRDEELLRIIQHNAESVSRALRKAALAAARPPPEPTKPVPETKRRPRPNESAPRPPGDGVRLPDVGYQQSTARGGKDGYRPGGNRHEGIGLASVSGSGSKGPGK